MSHHYLIRLSVYPYIRKYLTFHFGERFFVTERGYIPTLLENMLEHPPKVHPSQIKKKDIVKYGAFVGICIGEGTARRLGTHISSVNVVRANDAIADLIYQEMYRLIHQLKKAGYQVDDTIREFQNMYGFSEDEFPFENAKRWYYRERKRIADRQDEAAQVNPQFTLNFFEELEIRCGVKPISQTTLNLSA